MYSLLILTIYYYYYIYINNVVTKTLKYIILCYILISILLHFYFLFFFFRFRHVTGGTYILSSVVLFTQKCFIDDPEDVRTILAELARFLYVINNNICYYMIT